MNTNENKLPHSQKSKKHHCNLHKASKSQGWKQVFTHLHLFCHELFVLIQILLHLLFHELFVLIQILHMKLGMAEIGQSKVNKT